MFGCLLLLVLGGLVCEGEGEDSDSADDKDFCRCGRVGPRLLSTSPTSVKSMAMNKVNLRTLLTVALAKKIVFNLNLHFLGTENIPIRTLYTSISTPISNFKIFSRPFSNRHHYTTNDNSIMFSTPSINHLSHFKLSSANESIWD